MAGRLLCAALDVARSAEGAGVLERFGYRARLKSRRLDLIIDVRQVEVNDILIKLCLHSVRCPGKRGWEIEFVALSTKLGIGRRGLQLEVCILEKGNFFSWGSQSWSLPASLGRAT